jgi:hypothetical protein
VWWCCSYGHNAKHESYFEVGCQGRNRRVQQQPVKALPRASSKAEACTVMQGAQLPAAGRTFTQASRQRAEPRHHGQTAFSSCDSSQRQSAAKTGLERCGLYQSAEAAIAELRSSSLSTTASSSLTCSQTPGLPRHSDVLHCVSTAAAKLPVVPAQPFIQPDTLTHAPATRRASWCSIHETRTG